MSSQFTPSYEIFREKYPENITIPQAAEIANIHASTWFKWLKNDTEPVKSFVLNNSVRRVRLIDLCDFIDAQITAAQEPPATAPTKKQPSQRGRKQRFNPAVVAAAVASETHVQA